MRLTLSKIQTWRYLSLRWRHVAPPLRFREMSMFGMAPSSVTQRGNSALLIVSVEKMHNFRYSSSLATMDVGDDIHGKKTIPFLLADIGEGIAEVELLQWYVSPGDTVVQFDRVCEVQSDKATVEITSRYDGVVESLSAQAGDMISVGSPLLYIGTSGGNVSGNESVDTSNTRHAGSPTLNNVDDEEDKLHIPSLASKFDIGSRDGGNGNPKLAKVLATPAVRKLGMDYGIDWSNIVGTGPKGRVLKADVLQLQREKTQRAGVSFTNDSATSDHTGLAQRESIRRKDETCGPSVDTTVDIKGYSRLMIKSMTASLQIPHMCYADEIDMNQILRLRNELKPLAESRGVKLSILPFALKAVSLALKEYPILNSSLNAEEYKLTYHSNHNIGVAMDTPRGLAVPVVKGCENLSVLEIGKELQRLKERAMEGNLSEKDITGATFTLSNIGVIGGTYMSPIVTAPQVAIGAMGKIQRLPRFVGNNVEEVHIMQISWGGDHRVIDGATMARFSNQWKAFMESPMTMTLSMK